MATEHDFSDRKFTALYMGVVTDNADPERVGRVRVRIPGVVEPESAWAFPLGWAAAGGSQRGTFAPPPKGAEVGVFFHQGDPDHPYYISGHPGRGEQPPEALEGTPAEATQLFVHETDRWRLIFDDRAGRELFQIVFKPTGDVIELDGAQLGLRIKATAAIVLESDGSVDIRGSSVTIQGRQVTRNGKAI